METQQIHIRPSISYPREAQAGQSYLLTIDVQMSDDVTAWPYEEEEYPIICLVETAPLFTNIPIPADNLAPALLLHRFGSTYGPVRFLLTASQQEQTGKITVMLINQFGQLLKNISLESEVAMTQPQPHSTTTIVHENRPTPPSFASSPAVSPETPLPISELTIEQQRIEEQLLQTGWTIQPYDPSQAYFTMDTGTLPGIAIRNFRDTGDYLLFVQSVRQAVGIIQVIPVDESPVGMERPVSITTPLGSITLSFVYRSTGFVTYFTCDIDPEPRSRPVFTFHQPQTLQGWSEQIFPAHGALYNTPRSRLLAMRGSSLSTDILADQKTVITSLELSFARNHERTLVEIKDTSALRFTAMYSIYRLFQHAQVQHILYLVRSEDQVSQAIEVFNQFSIPGRQRERFTSQFALSILQEADVLTTSGVYISSPAMLYSKQASVGPNLASPHMGFTTDGQFVSSSVLSEVHYNPQLPIESFDFIFIEDWTPELYSQWGSLLEYFDAFLVGFTSVADDIILAFFQKNLVYTTDLVYAAAQGYDTDTAQPLKADVLLVTVTEIEVRAVLDLFSNFRRIFHEHRIYYDLDIVGGARIFMVQSEMGAAGPGASLFTVSEGIRDLSPSAVVMVGIAYGLDSTKQQIGDILVSQQIISYEQQRAGSGSAGEILSRGVHFPASVRLLARFRNGLKDWQGQKVTFGLILSGEKLMDQSEVRAQLRELEPEAIGGEMEGVGLYATATTYKVDWILVKAICDWADATINSNIDENQQKAARNAAQFTLYVLQQGGFTDT